MTSPTAASHSAPGTEFATRHKVRVVTAASLFDGHDAAINIMRRLLQQEGAEVIHLGHNRSVEEIAEAAVQEDAQAVAVSSYQGGHLEFFRYLVQRLAERGAGHIQVYGGGGGTITDAEIAELHAAGVRRIYSVEDGRRLGLTGMIRDLLAHADFATMSAGDALPEGLFARRPVDVAKALSLIETLNGTGSPRLEEIRGALAARLGAQPAPVVGITGTGGAGKSSLTDELVRRFLDRFPDRTVAILAVDPSKRRTGGALLGDRIRMNAAHGPRVYMRSMATRRANVAVAGAVGDALLALRAAGHDLVILETAGIGQSDSAVVDLCDVSVYVMTPEYGAPTQLEKIEMLDFADLVAINKRDKRGADDALRHVRKQVQRNRKRFETAAEELPVFLTAASRYADPGVDALFLRLTQELAAKTGRDWEPAPAPAGAAQVPGVVPAQRERYLAEIAEACRGHRRRVEAQAEVAARADGLARALAELGDAVPPTAQEYAPAALTDPQADPAVRLLRQRYNELLGELQPEMRAAVAGFDALKAGYEGEHSAYQVRGREIRVRNHHVSLSGTQVPKVVLPATRDWGERLRWLGTENVPGAFPYTAGVFPFKRTQEDPTRMFAGEGTAERTNRRFHFVSHGQPAQRLSTAFDSVTLYGEDPALRPDIFGKVGNSGVSICTVDDAKRLYSGFDLCAPTTSVSMTINGPAPMILAMFLNAAIDQAVERRLKETGRWEQAQRRIQELCGGRPPAYRGALPPGHDGHGLGTLGVSGDRLLPAQEYEQVKAAALAQVRGTVQADILKEDQAQNTCIFSTDFALKMMGDVQQYFVDHDVRNFYSVSISGYHIAEAGATPITQLAFTLANGFTYAEYYRARGMAVNDFAPNLSFFFSNGLDAEYAVIGRVARRIWSVAMRDVYGGDERAQKLKYHIQTSGRSLHAQEVDFNDIRTTLQALYAIFDNCQSLHTNAYDEAITTPTEESVRRALAIQLIINRELGLGKNENPLQGAFVIQLLTDLVEEAVLAEFERISARGGVLGAMETMYQRGKIQDESLHYETLKHSGELPIVGVNTFVHPHKDGKADQVAELIRSTEEERQVQVTQVHEFEERHRGAAEPALMRLRRTALEGGNLFAELMETVKTCTLGQISRCLYDVGGQYRRNV
ncbi:MAG: methylmalonyl-CoA mutase [Planctomycetota bacterium]|nr:MAG: methylmalonyl-CoA mutase [Planctomycetota bacterium]